MTSSIIDILANGPITCLVSDETWYQVFEERDKDGGRGGSDLRFCVRDRNEAEALARGLGIYGDSGRIVGVIYLKITPTTTTRNAPPYFLIPAASPSNESEIEQAKLRASAISKLTPAEWAAIQAAKR